ncbi:glycosyltransferase [Pontibacter sp. G13]|uniref:glycosyltransferase n=1 Tax=Pontibacter sp. G13 TaxID=3074898 RepID=UPI00288980C3|nr:glycosyltransferase [Pontibacter sp. G13]WNJ19314.1 glycosyltransferase [Pontibacter sp. G13]
MQIIHLVLGKARLNRMNGVNKVAHNLALHQTHLGHAVQIWGITPTPTQGVEQREYGLRLFRANPWKLWLDDELQQAFEELKGKEALVHIHGIFIPEFYHAAKALHHLGIPYVFCPHGGLSPVALQRSAWRKELYLKLFEGWVLKHAHAVQFLGQNQFQTIDKRITLSNKVLIPNGQNLSELAYTPTDIPRPEGPLFSFCGRLDIRYKGLDILIEGMYRYLKTGGTGVLWLIGDGGDRKELEQRVEQANLNESVLFLGPKFGAEKLNLIGHSDLFVHPSYSEGLPTSVLEAAGLGVPCMVSFPTNMGDAIRNHDAGIYLEDLSAEGIGKELLRAEALFHRGQLAPMGERAHSMIATEYNWERIARRTIEMYAGTYA